MLQEVEARRRPGRAVRVVEGVLDGDAHVGEAQLGLEGAVDELDERVDEALGMDEDVDRGRTPTSYSQCASMTSRPLFMSVAESMVILAPMSQVGCARASSGGRAAASRSADQSRNGPPEAVRISRATVAMRLAGEALPERRVLRVDGPEPGQRAAMRVGRVGRGDLGGALRGPAA